MYVDSLLCHSRRTAGKHYRLTQREKNAIRGTKVLEEVFSRKIKVEWDKKKLMNWKPSLNKTWSPRKCQ